MEPQVPRPRSDARDRIDPSDWFADVLQDAAAAFLLCDAQGRILTASSGALLLLARRSSELDRLPFDRFVHPDDLGLVPALIGRAVADDEHAEGRVRCLAPDGDEIPAAATVRRLPDHVDPDGPAAATVELRDLRPQLSRALAEAQALSHAVLNSVSDGILVVTRAGLITRANPAAERILGTPPGGLAGASVHQFVPPAVRGRHAQLIADFSAVGPHVMGAHRQLTGLRSDGSVVPLEVTLTEVSEYGKDHVCAVIRDVTDRLEFETRLMDQARTDALTGLPNRVVLDERLNLLFARLERHDGCVAVLIADVDNFKAINDVYGHAVGDSALVHIAERLRQAVRSTDTLVRLGGDEFAVVADELDEADPGAGMLALAERLRAAAAQPITAGARELRATLSVGACLARSPASRDTVLANADLALYEAKRTGRNTVVGYDPGMRLEATRAQTLREQLHDALRRDELVAHYQPLVDLGTHQVLGVEALVRWQHPWEGLLLPGAFLPAAMFDDLIVEIDLTVLRTAVAAVAEVSRVHGEATSVWVNVAGPTLASGRLVAALEEAVDRTGLDPARITVEISESALPTDSPRLLGALYDIEATGARLAIDDFGTGYCSLAHLTRLPLHAVKLDRSMLANDQASALVPGLVSILRALQLVPVVEGIEDAVHLERARTAGASVGQGFGLARPMPLEQLRTWL
jgi:diguanylate cyclase (GGDEF)-like protein/PAS domain S-box-containing protein